MTIFGLPMSFIQQTTETKIITKCGGFLSTRLMMVQTGQRQIYFTGDTEAVII